MAEGLRIPTPLPALPQFNRDLVVGDTGEDVAALQRVLIAFGRQIDEEALRQKRFDESTMAALEVLMRQAQENKKLKEFFDYFVRHVLNIEPEEYGHPELGRGTRSVLRNYRTGTIPELRALEVAPFQEQGIARAGELARRFIGLREEGENAGAIVVHCAGRTGLPWCGAFAHYIFEKIAPGVYNQNDFMRARSFMEEGRRARAFHQSGDGYVPQVGDAVVFTRGTGDQGHVGIVTAVNGDQITYVSGNDGNAVRERQFYRDHPPGGLLGFSDTRAVARAKGIAVARDNSTVNHASAASQSPPTLPHADVAEVAPPPSRTALSRAHASAVLA